MQDTTNAASVVKSTIEASRLNACGAELAYTSIALFSFAAALYALWLASISAGLAFSQQVVPNPAAAGPAQAGIAWGSVALACLVAAGLIWVSISMLGKSSYLATVRRLVALTQELSIPDSVKLEVMLGAAGTELQNVVPRLVEQRADDEALRAAVAGNWVLARFREGASVVAVPESMATLAHLQAAFSNPSIRPIQILRNDLDLRNAESLS
jgi:hypothetical protein